MLILDLIVYPKLQFDPWRKQLVRLLDIWVVVILREPTTALELREYNITVNAYAPGVIDTPMSMFILYPRFESIDEKHNSEA
jgi:hypothetical protein